MEFNKKKLITIGLGVSLILGVTMVTPTKASAAVQVPADKVFASQQDTGKNSAGNCSPATAKMILNAYGLGTNLTVQDISEKYGGLGHGDTVLKKFGIEVKLIDNNDELAKQYLDQGYILSAGIYNGYGPHEGVILDYRTTNGYIEYYTLDPSKSSCEPYWSRKDSNDLIIGSVSVTNVNIYNKLEKVTVKDTSKDGKNTFDMTLLYDKTNGVFLYSKEDNLKYTGTTTDKYNNALKIYNENKDNNWFNVVDTVYEVKDSIALVNNDAYFTLTKEFVSKTWGIVR